MIFRQLQDAQSSTFTYLLADPVTREAVLIDPVAEQADRDAALIAELGLDLLYTLDTHAHADHVTGAGLLRDRLGARTVVSRAAGVACADVLVDDGDVLRFGSCGLEVRSTPGHTAGCVSFVTLDQDMIFTGDALLIGGCGRTDFQQGDAATLYRSLHGRVFTLPDTTRVYPGHDYKGRTVSTVGEEKANNPRLGGGRSEAEFVAIMAGLDLAYPRKIDVSLPANLRCGEEVPHLDLPVARAAAIPEVEPDWLVANRVRVRLVDVRSACEFTGAMGHAHGAESIPMEELGEAAASWDRDRPVALICRTGHRSGLAARQLESLGFRRVASVRGGMVDWCARGLPCAGAEA